VVLLARVNFSLKCGHYFVVEESELVRERRETGNPPARPALHEEKIGEM
jgi:hypothetical protein